MATVWSPLGLSKGHGCVLASLDSHHQVSIWQPTGVGHTEKWIPVSCFVNWLIVGYQCHGSIVRGGDIER